MEIIAGWDDRFNREIYEKFGHERLLRIFMPIEARDRVIGVIEVGYDRRERGHIDDDQVRLLRAFVDQAAVALVNAGLFEQMQTRVESERIVRQISEQLGRTTDVETVLRTTVTMVGQALGAPRTYIRLGTEADLAVNRSTGPVS